MAPRPGQGAIAAGGGATWINRTTPGTAWTTIGGQFSGVDSASLTVTDVFSNYTWPLSSAEVEDMLDNPATNFGWILRGDESAAATVKWFASREFTTASQRPKLIVDFTRPLP